MIVAPFVTILIKEKDTEEANNLRNIVTAGTVLFALVEAANMNK